MKREIFLRNKLMGVMGEDAGHKNYKVGDIIFWKSRYSAEAGVIVKYDNCYCVMGWCGNELYNNEIDILGKVISYKNVTKEVLSCFNSVLEIKECKEQKEISSSEAFEVLKNHYGCEVKIKE